MSTPKLPHPEHFSTIGAVSEGIFSDHPGFLAFLQISLREQVKSVETRALPITSVSKLRGMIKERIANMTFIFQSLAGDDSSPSPTLSKFVTEHRGWRL